MTGGLEGLPLLGAAALPMAGAAAAGVPPAFLGRLVGRSARSRSPLWSGSALPVTVIPYVFKQIHCELKHPLICSYILTLPLFITSRSYPDEWPTLIGQIKIQKVLERILISLRW